MHSTQDEVAALKQQLADKEAELQALQDKFSDAAARLDRVVNLLKK